MRAGYSRRRLMGGAAGGVAAAVTGLPAGFASAQTADSNHEVRHDEATWEGPDDEADGQSDDDREQEDEAGGQGDGDTSQGGEPGSRGIGLLRAWVGGEITLGDVSLQPDWSFYLLSTGTSFSYPPDWTVSEIIDPDLLDPSDGNRMGGLVLSPDQSAAVLMLNLLVDPSVPLAEVAWAQMEQLVGAGEPTRLVEEELPSASSDFTWYFVAGDIGGTICAGFVSSLPDPQTGSAFGGINLAASEAQAFDDLTEQVFLPVLLSQVTSGGSGGPGGGDDDDDDDDEDDPDDV